MLIIKFHKLFPANLLSHIDILHLFNRIFRRAGVKVRYSEGFVPHMLLYFSPTMPLGISSVCEYVAADVDGEICMETALAAKLNAACPVGIFIESCALADKNPNYAAIVDKAEYEVELEGIGGAAQKLAAAQNFEIEHGEKVKDARPLVYGVKILAENKAAFVLACGSIKNLKCDELVFALCKTCNLNFSAAKILKTKMFTGDQEI